MTIQHSQNDVVAIRVRYAISSPRSQSQVASTFFLISRTAGWGDSIFCFAASRTARRLRSPGRIRFRTSWSSRASARPWMCSSSTGPDPENRPARRACCPDTKHPNAAWLAYSPLRRPSPRRTTDRSGCFLQSPFRRIHILPYGGYFQSASIHAITAPQLHVYGLLSCSIGIEVQSRAMTRCAWILCLAAIAQAQTGYLTYPTRITPNGLAGNRSQRRRQARPGGR